VPDAPTIGPVPPLVQAHQIGKLLFARIREYWAKHSVQVCRGPIEDAISISAPSSLTPRQQAWDPKRHQIKTVPPGVAVVTTTETDFPVKWWITQTLLKINSHVSSHYTDAGVKLV